MQNNNVFYAPEKQCIIAYFMQNNSGFYAAEQQCIIKHFMQNNSGFYAEERQCITTHFMQNNNVCSSRILCCKTCAVQNFIQQDICSAKFYAAGLMQCITMRFLNGHKLLHDQRNQNAHNTTHMQQTESALKLKVQATDK